MSPDERIEHLEWCIAEMTSEAPALADMPLHLEPAKRRLLGLLMSRAPSVVPRDALMAALFWHLHPDDWPEDENIIAVHVSQIRRKLREGGVSGEIKAVVGMGYQWVPAGKWNCADYGKNREGFQL